MVINQLQNTQNPLAFRHLLLQISYYTFAAMVFYKLKLVESRSEIRDRSPPLAEAILPKPGRMAKQIRKDNSDCLKHLSVMESL